MNPASRRTSGPRRQKGVRPENPPAYNQYGQFNPAPQLFNDTSGGYVPPYPQSPGMAGGPPGGWDQNYPQPAFPGQQLLTDPMASMAMQYGQTIAGQGKQMVEEKLEKYVSISKVKYYFAVDTGYVTKKLGLLFFPFTHKEWAVRFNNQNEPVAPRYDVNAPDLYIPSMAFVTYILIAGYILGSQSRFSPEQLGMQASSALGWSLVEIAILFFALYLSNVTPYVKVFDLVAFCSYKYVCMVAALIACISFQSLGYYVALGYCTLSLGFFLIRTLRVLILPKTTADHFSSSSRHSSYLLLGISIIQPILMYVLTKHLVSPPPVLDVKI
ncbi:protein YIF1B-B-like [Argiope bruennichi]|uniref:Protein YIF1 n=1 Tax=Argiope bruennichi TaxID=94029 RepID=A0A8T0FVM8_ARGBR|nr:protein YIF1B-B-like [Argiope bruennichi]KAF8794335.1 Protein YIF1B-B like protein [Argiope bruennichi]